MVYLVEWGEGIERSEKRKPLERAEARILSHNSIEEDVTSVEYIQSKGYIRIGVLGLLMQQRLPILPDLDSCGIYAISIPEDYELKFITPEVVSEIRNVINPWVVESLKAKWVNDVDIVYYGLAGRSSPRTLRERINELLRHGRGETTVSGPHKGGEILWQLGSFEAFSLWVFPTGHPPEPRQLEKFLLRSFHAQIGQLPYANRQF